MKRRDFIRNSVYAMAAGSGFASTLGRLAMANTRNTTANMRKGAEDYRALICVYLFGGNDSFNMVVPTDGDYDTYAATRGGLAVAAEDLLPLNALEGPLNGGSYGLHPAMNGTAAMFNNGQAAIIANVGPLVRPVNKQSYATPGTLLPANLFSHADQMVQWQTPRADTSARTGWGGLLADQLGSTFNIGSQLPMGISLAGENVFLAGLGTSPFVLSPQGVDQIYAVDTGASNCTGALAYNQRRCASFEALLLHPHAHPFQRAYADKVQATRERSGAIKAALDMFPANDLVYAPFWTENGLQWSNTNPPALPPLAAQLLMAARAIRARMALGMNRQLFFVALSGFDTHADQLQDHPLLLSDLSQSIKAFYDVMGSAEFNLSNQITTFTASDFGRTLTNNGDGTDHGWGGHHMVFGGSVRGQRLYGRMPNLGGGVENPDNAGWGQIIPTLSVDQYAATLATWFGISSTERDLLFPNLQYMNGPLISVPQPDLGFMGPLPI